MNAWDWFAIILAAAGTAIALYGAYILFGLLLLPFVLIYRFFTFFSPNPPAPAAVCDDVEEDHRPAKKEKKEVEWPPHHEYYFPSSRDEAEGANSPYWSD